MRSEGRGCWAGLLGVLACAGACARNTSAGDAGDAGAGVVGDGAAGDGVSGDGVSPADGEGLPLGAEVLTPREPNRIPICSPDNVCWFTPEHGLSNPAILGTVLALAENDVWMAHLHGSVQHWDGRTRTTVFAEGDGLGAINAVWGSGPNDVWALPSGTTSIDHWDGTQWSSMELPTSAAMYGLAGWSATSVWVVGEEGAVLRWDGARWNEIPRLEGVADSGARALRTCGWAVAAAPWRTGTAPVGAPWARARSHTSPA